MFDGTLVAIAFLISLSSAALMEVFQWSSLEDRRLSRLATTFWLSISFLASLYCVCAGFAMLGVWTDPFADASPEQLRGGSKSGRGRGGIIILIIKYWPYILIGITGWFGSVYGGLLCLHLRKKSESLSLKHAVALTVVGLMRADGAFSDMEVSVAAKLLLKNFGSPGETHEDAVKLIQEVNEVLAKLDYPTAYGNVVGGAALSVKEQTSHKQRVALYVQLNMIAHSDGCDKREWHVLRLIKKGWGLEDDVTGAVDWEAKNWEL